MMYRGLYMGDPGSADDEYIVRQAASYFRHLDVSGRVVMDVGAHFGAFTVGAVGRGAARVVAFEPHPENCAILRRNVETLDAVTVVEAAVGLEDGTARLNFHPRYSSGPSVFRSPRGSTGGADVEAVSFARALREYRPAVIKMDCEGSEFDLLTAAPLPRFVRQVYCEIHLWNKTCRERYDDVVKMFADWTPVKPPKDNWTYCLACWRRDV